MVIGVGFGGQLGRWVAFALLLTLAPRLLAPLQRLPLIANNRERIDRWLPLLVLGALTLALLGDMFLGRPPISRDHGVHYFQTRILVDELLPRGRLIGWSDRLNTGYPFGDSYPVLGYVMTGAAHVLSFGLIPLRVSYAWGLLGVWLLALWGVWWLAATIGRELEDQAAVPEGQRIALLDPRWAGALAAVAWLIDPGSSREGGWNYLMFHGVWPQLLSSALWIASLPATWAALRRPSPRSLAFAALLLGASVLAHPFGMLTAAISGVAWPVALWATGALPKLPGGQIRWWLLIHAAAGLVCIGWLVTFLASAGAMSRSPVPWRPLSALATSLLSGELFRDYRAWVGPMMVVGLIAAIRRGRTVAWLGVGLVCVMLVLGSQASITVLRLDLLTSSFKNLQFPRYAIALKPVLYAFAGVGGALLLARLRQLPEAEQPSDVVQPAAARLIACVCLAPLLLGILDEPGRLFPRPVGGVEVLEDSPHADVDEALLDALRDEAELLAAEPNPRRLNVAFLRGGQGGGTYPLFAITDADARLIMDGHIPAVNYKYQVRRRHPSSLRVMGVTHVIWENELKRSSDDRQLAAALETIGEFGVWKLGRLEPGSLQAGFAVTGKLVPDNVQITHATDEVRIDIAAGSGRLDVPVGPYRKWTAARDDGQRVGLEAVALTRGLPGMKLNVDGPGAITLEYQRPQAETIAAWISVLAWLALLACLFSARELQLAVRVPSQRAARISWALGLATLLVIVVGSYARQERQLARTWQRLLNDHRKEVPDAEGRDLKLRVDLIDRGKYEVTRSTTDGCDGTLGKDAMAGCTQDEARPRKAMVFRAPYLYRCLHVQVPARGSLDIELQDLQDGDDIAGFFYRDVHKLEGITLTLPGSDAAFESEGMQKRQHFHVTAEARNGESVISVRNDGDRDQRLCFVIGAAQRAD